MARNSADSVIHGSFGKDIHHGERGCQIKTTGEEKNWGSQIPFGDKPPAI